jgi:hypothetical protein
MVPSHSVSKIDQCDEHELGWNTDNMHIVVFCVQR